MTIETKLLAENFENYDVILKEKLLIKKLTLRITKSALLLL